MSRKGARVIAALYIEPEGCYAGLPDVDAWCEARDARRYAGPWPVVAHPPCQRWGRFWHGSTRKPHQFKMGDDGGCFAHALLSVATNGGVIEHPCDSHAWRWFGLRRPMRHAGWQRTPGPLIWWVADGTFHLRDRRAGEWWTAYVEQGHYGHKSRKPTWLLFHGPRSALPELDWSRGAQRLPQWMIDRYGYAKARRIGVTAMEGGKHKTRNRNATPLPFRDVLIEIAKAAR